MTGGFPTYISAANTYVIVASAGELVRIIVGETAAGSITIKDGDTTKAVLKASIAEGVYDFDFRFKSSLTIITAADSKITVVTR